MSLQIIIAGIIILAAGIILNYFIPNRYWVVLIAVGVIVIIIGVIYLALGPVLLLTPTTYPLT